MRTLNWTRGIGYNLVAAQVRNSNFLDPDGTGLVWLATLAEVSYVEFGEPFPQYTPAPHLRMADRSTLSGFAADILLDMIDNHGVSAQDLFEVAYAVVRGLSMLEHFKEGSR